MDLPAVIRHIDQPASCQTAVLQLGDFVGGRLAVRRHAQRRLEPLARALDDRRRQCLAGRCLRHAPVGALAGEHIRNRLRRMPAASDRERRSRRRCGSRYAVLRPAIALPSTLVAFNKFAMPAWVSGRPGLAMPSRAAKAGERSGRNSATVPPAARWPSLTASRQKSAARSSLARRRCNIRQPWFVRSLMSRRDSIPPSLCRLKAWRRRRPDRSS